MIKYFCCSDIHSFFDEWMDALTEKGFELNNLDHHIVICGDLFDRGPDAIKCFNFVKEMKQKNRLHYIRGNHEDLLCDLYHDMMRGTYISNHHFSNGTVNTVTQILGLQSDYDVLHSFYNRGEFEEKVGEVLDFFQDTCEDYFEVSDHIFVHGWLPCEIDDNPVYIAGQEFDRIYPQWSNNYDSFERDRMWEGARWINGMLAWAQGMRIEGKTIVCGHWHTSWGHSTIHGHCAEWGPNANFSIFKDKGVIALDACTALSGKVNCYVLEVDN